MQKFSHFLTSFLVWAGAVPFVVGTVLLLAGVRGLSPLFAEEDLVARGLALYALVIVVFLAGSLWRQQHSASLEPVLAVSSNLLALLACFIALVLPFGGQFPVFAVFLLALLWLEWWRFRHKAIGRDYFRLRCRVTALVVMLLLVSAFAV